MDATSSSSEDGGESWIDSFLAKDGNEFLCEIDIDYIQDNFNLYGLRDVVHNYKMSLKMITDHYENNVSDADDDDVDYCNARQLYGLIHQRFILTRRGLDKMVRSLTTTKPDCNFKRLNAHPGPPPLRSPSLIAQTGTHTHTANTTAHVYSCTHTHALALFYL